MALVIADEVVMAGQPYRQNICLRGVAHRKQTLAGVLTESQNLRGTLIESTSTTGRIIESTRIQATWLLCVKPVGAA